MEIIITAHCLAKLNARTLEAMNVKDVRSMAKRLSERPVRLHASYIKYVVKRWPTLNKSQLVHAMINVVEDVRRRLDAHETERRRVEVEMSSEPVKGTKFEDINNSSFQIVVSHVNRNGSLTCWPTTGSRLGAAMISLRRNDGGASSFVGHGTGWVRVLSSAAALANKD